MNIVIVFLLGFIVFNAIREYIERQRLLDRIAARNLPELAHIENERLRARANVRMPTEKTVEL